jgi:hypothetical protein
MCLIIGIWNKICTIRLVWCALNAFQMENKLILDSTSNTISHPLKNIDIAFEPIIVADLSRVYIIV